MQAQYDQYIVHEVMPFVRGHLRSHDVGIWTMGASLGGYHAANTLLKHPDVVKRCFALSGVYDMKRFMGGDYDDNFYFNNPVDYCANLTDGWALHHLASCDIHLATGTGPWEHPQEAYRLSGILAQRGIPHHLDDWGHLGGHDWPYWRHQMWEYMNKASLLASRDYSPSVSSRYLPVRMTCSSSIQTLQSRVSTSTCVVDFQSAPVWLP